MFARDLQGNEYPLMATYTINDELNGNINLDIDLLPNKANLLCLKDIDVMWEIVDDDGIVYKVIYAKKNGVGSQLSKSIKAIPKLYDDLERTRVYERYDGSYSIEQLFSIAFQPVDYDYKLIGSWSTIKIEGYGDGDTCLAMFQKILNRIGAEFTFMGKSVTIRKKIGTDKGLFYSHRLNASNIVHEIDGKDYWTYAKGFGDFEESESEKAKLKTSYSSPLMKLLGKREAPPIKDGRIKKKETLDAALKKAVDESLKISVTADLIDLSKQNYPYAHSDLGDVVTVMDQRIGLKEDVRVVARSITRNWRKEIIDLKFTFGTGNLTKRYNAKLSNAATTINNILEGKQKLPFPAMSNEIQLISNVLKSVKTQLKVSENGSILAIDKKDPNSVVILNAAGIGISDDGGQTFKNALTGRGLLADAIVANSITADKLDVNAITVGFNKSSTNIKLFKDKLEFYRKNKLSGKITEAGSEYWYGDKKIGVMGEAFKVGNSKIRGIAMNLENDGDFVTFGYRKSSSDDQFTSYLTLDPKGRYSGSPGLHFGDSVNMNGHPLKGMSEIAVQGGSGRILTGYIINKDNGNKYVAFSSVPKQAGVLFGGSDIFIMAKNKIYSMDKICTLATKLSGLGRVLIPTELDSNGSVKKWKIVTL